MNDRSQNRQRGVALITALLIVSLLAIVGLNLTWDAGMDMRRTMTSLYHDEGVQAAYGAEELLRGMLRDDAAESDIDHLGEIWAAEYPPLPIESDTIQGGIQGAVTDLQGRFNINNLVDQNGSTDEEVLQQFRRLLAALEIDTRLAGITADWLDSDDETGLPDGAEDSIYTGKIPPYLAANRTIAHVSELMALDGMDKPTFDTLSPYIAALPKNGDGRPSRINVNTAPAIVLQSLDENLSEDDIERLLSEREDGGFADYETAFSAILDPQIVERYLGETSQFFQLTVVVQIDTVRIRYFSVLFRESRGGATVPILRSFGTT